jgi:ribosome-associated protein
MSAAAAPMTTAEMIGLITDYAQGPKAVDLVVLDLSGASAFTDAFVIATGRSDRQVKAIHDSIHQGMKNDHAMLPNHVEGLAEANWVLLDYGDVVVHVFTPATREYYRLETLWGEVPRRTIASGEPDPTEDLVDDDATA